jgi:hypothetical protein
MCYTPIKYKSLLRPFLLLAFQLLYTVCFSQGATQEDLQNDTIIRIPKGALIHALEGGYKFVPDTVLTLPNNLIPPRQQNRDKNLIFYDSLKVRAAKKPFTKKLYAFVVVMPQPISSKQITLKSDEGYINYKGRIIRKIEIRQLDVFGTSVNNPESSHPSGIEKLLNGTHINTNVKIIRNNLIFTEGDSVSPLKLSDNERILRQLPFIDDARIIVVPVSDTEADIVVVTKDLYSLGGSYDYKGFKAGEVSVFEKNILGIGHELGFDIPFNSNKTDSPGFGVHYYANNVGKSFINLSANYLKGLGQETYGFSLNKKLLSATTKYAGGISVRQMYTTVVLDSILPLPLKYNLQDYWISRSFLVNEESVARIILGTRYTNNNVFYHPEIMPDSYHYLQRYKMFLGSMALSFQKYYKTNLIYGYGRAEDVPIGSLIKLTVGHENNEFKTRDYAALEASSGKYVSSLGYFYTTAGLGSYINNTQTEQGVFSLNLEYFTNLLPLGRNRIRNFITANYTRGFDRNTDELLYLNNKNGFAGFRNDSVSGNQRVTLNFESVLFSNMNFYNFKFAFFAFSDFSFLAGTNEYISSGSFLTELGVGVRIRNDNLVFKTFQIRICIYPDAPPYSKTPNLIFSGEQLLQPHNFDPGPPSIIQYR